MDRFGATLKQTREARKLSLEDVALATKIGVRFLKALEDEDFQKLPGGVFNKSFTRTYARELGLNEQEAVAGYLKASGGETAPEPKLEELAAARQRERQVPHWKPGAGFSQLPWGSISIALVVAAIALTIWGSRNRENVQTLPRPHANEPVRASATPTPAQPGVSVVATPVSSPSPEVTMTASGPAEQAAAAATASGRFEVKVKAREDAWISVTADGQQIMQDVLTAQTEKSIEARSQVIIRTGNVGALDFSFAGKKLPAQGDYGEVRTLTFDSNGLQPSLRKAAMSN
jgi:cytoskeleton protein RodZ